MKIVKTNDGSHSLYVEELDEHYHSIHGAVQEANHVFIRHGLAYFESKKPSKLRVFEMGFGTGMNAFLAMQYAHHHDIEMYYDGIEAYPVSEELIQQLNYFENIEANEEEKSFFYKMHHVEWDKEVGISSKFTLSKIHRKIEDYELNNEYDIVFYDAFGPRAQGEMWEKEILEKVCNGIKEGGVFVTYCAKGQLKRDLKSLGFEVESLPGPPGKREMVRGVKIGKIEG